MLTQNVEGNILHKLTTCTRNSVILVQTFVI